MSKDNNFVSGSSGPAGRQNRNTITAEFLIYTQVMDISIIAKSIMSKRVAVNDSEYQKNVRTNIFRRNKWPKFQRSQFIYGDLTTLLRHKCIFLK